MHQYLHQRYGMNMALFADLYQLTMAYGYWKQGLAERQAVFYAYYRRPPLGGHYALAAGLEEVVHWLEQWHLEASDVDYLSSLTDGAGASLFESAFLEALANLRFTGDLYAVPEGTVVFPQQPLLRLQAPLWQAQLAETAILNALNFQTLIATQAARLVQAANGDAVLEFGARRAQGWDGALSASRAAYLGGCAATSNVLAGKLYGIPVKGTHSHSWVMSFENERQAFEAYAAAFPSQCVFLVDTYNTLDGVRQAIAVGRQLRAQGQDLLGIRLDSGDLAILSRQARLLLDEAGFEQTTIIGSDGLDATKIRQLKAQGACIGLWGVGTQLVTAAEQPSLGGVYKLAALQDANGNWQPKIKLSDTPEKISTPGLLQVRRYAQSDGLPFGDVIWNEQDGAPEAAFSSFDGRAVIARDRPYEDLLQPIFVKGQRQGALPDLGSSRAHAAQQRALFEQVDFRWYPIGLEERLRTLKKNLVQQYWGGLLQH